MCEVVKVLERELENFRFDICLSGRRGREMVCLRAVCIFPQPDDGRSCIGTICHG